LRDTIVKITSVVSRFVQSVRADFGSTQRYRSKYHADSIATSKLPSALITKIGFQMLANVRVMQALSEASVPVLPQVMARLIRHLYGAEIHWKAKIAPGVSIVHGNGLVISKEATVGPGCILFQNVTLGQGIDPITRLVGGPTLGEDVHVGPGATLIGPIHIGRGTKIMAGAVVTMSVPERSVVLSPVPEVAERGKQSG
jgi:serine O-acetyltransferase